MAKRAGRRCLAAFLALILVLGTVGPIQVFAAEETVSAPDAAVSTTAAEPMVTTYDEFLASLKVLEDYADTYAAANQKTPLALVLNFIRTGVARYNEGLWVEAAGAEETAFVNYVAQQDAANHTNAMGLRNLPEDGFTAPNGQSVEFEHMFGAMDMGYHTPANADMGSWAGDVVDLMECGYNLGVPADTIDAKADYIRTNYLGVSLGTPHSFNSQDIYADLDAFYFLKKIPEITKLSSILEPYFQSITDVDRAAFFVNHRFPGSVTKESVRAALFDVYSKDGKVALLEAARNLDTETELRMSTCYAFADYIFALADGKLKPVDPVDPEPPTPPTPPEPEKPENNPFYEVFFSHHSTLAPGVEQDIKKAMTADDKQIVYYIATADITRDDVDIYANYNNNDGSKWEFSTVMEQVAAAKAKHSNPNDAAHYIENYTPVVSTNADFYNMSTAEPTMLVIEGIVHKEYCGKGNFFGILKDGTPVIGGQETWDANVGNIRDAVGGSVYLVKDGKIAVDPEKHNPNARASRTCVGITADHKVVLMVLDGRQEPFSAGATVQELAQIMLDAGCVTAINLDGGGSTTYVAKQEGENEVRVVNRPSDGNPRAVASSLLVVSHGTPTNEFDHAAISTEYEYLTAGSKLPVSYIGVSSSGNEATVPMGAVLQSADDSIGTVSEITVEGVTKYVFTAKTLGDTELQLVSADGTILGRKTVHVVNADGVKFGKSMITAIYGKSVSLPIALTYNGNLVAANGGEVRFELSAPAAGSFDGFTFTAAGETCGIRTTKVKAILCSDETKTATAKINLYKDGEAAFNFDTADNVADSATPAKLAWNRNVSNGKLGDITEEEPVPVYHLVDPKQGMSLSYVFALDMNSLAIPPNIQQALPILAEFLGVKLDDVTAWELLMMLAERVSPSSQVKVTIQMDPALEFDLSDLRINCECFEVTSASVDENNTATILCNWIKRTGPMESSSVNPICTLSGIKIKPKADAPFDAKNQLDVTLSGGIHYDARVRSSQAFNIAGSQLGQKFGLYQYDNTANLVNDKGAGFESDHCTFTDHFVLDNTVLNGWVQIGEREGEMAYYVDNVRKTNCIEKLPAQDGSADAFYYEFDALGVCRGKYTGFMESPEGLRYAINGVLKTGWRLITDETDGKDYNYYFDPKTGLGVDGKKTIDGFRYVFENKRLVKGDLRLNTYTYDKNDPRYGKPVYQYRWAGLWVALEWVNVDGKTIYFDHMGWAMTNVFRTYNEYKFYVADAKGAVQTNLTGLYDYTHKDGTVKTYYCVQGELQSAPGLVLIDGYYYYFASDSAAVKNCDYWPTLTNGLVPENRCYHFDEQGRMTNPPEKPDPDQPDVPVKNGLVEENGNLYYYVDGVLTGAGLIKIGEDYYYISTSTCAAVCNRTYWVTKTNDLLPAGPYAFGPDGKMLNRPVDPTPDPGPDPEPEPPVPPVPEEKNGIVEVNGKLYYYEHNEIVPAGLVKIGEDYYYARTSTGEIVTNREYWVSKTNDLLPAGPYAFGPDGKMINPPVAPTPDPGPDPEPEPPAPPVPEEKNGIVEENGKLYYYEHNEIVPAGLVKIGEDYYYARTSSGEIVTNREYWVSKTNDLLPAGPYQFGPDGKMMSPPTVAQ